MSGATAAPGRPGLVPGGTTRVFALIGHPVGQVRSPTVFNEYAAANGIDAVMVALDLEPGMAEAHFRAVRAWRNCGGCAVTIPHKQAALAQADTASERARRVGAANLVRRDADGRLHADMVDGLGFVAALAGHGVSPAGKRAVVVGAGGAGSAIADALAEAGAARIAVVEIDPARRRRLLDALGAAWPAAELSDDPGDPGAIDILANASPMGMAPGDPLPFPLDGVPPGALVADAVTKPATTPFLEAARARGCAIQRGAEMAEAQLPIFLERFGVVPPAR